LEQKRIAVLPMLLNVSKLQDLIWKLRLGGAEAVRRSDCESIVFAPPSRQPSFESFI